MILPTTLNARYAHTELGLRCLYASMEELQSQTKIVEFTINDAIQTIAEDILQNNNLSFIQIQKMKRFARFWDIFYNSGNFDLSVERLEKTLPFFLRQKLKAHTKSATPILAITPKRQAKRLVSDTN
jgi:hypothetical protein